MGIRYIRHHPRVRSSTPAVCATDFGDAGVYATTPNDRPRSPDFRSPTLLGHLRWLSGADLLRLFACHGRRVVSSPARHGGRAGGSRKPRAFHPERRQCIGVDPPQAGLPAPQTADAAGGHAASGVGREPTVADSGSIGRDEGVRLRAGRVTQLGPRNSLRDSCLAFPDAPTVPVATDPPIPRAAGDETGDDQRWRQIRIRQPRCRGKHASRVIRGRGSPRRPGAIVEANRRLPLQARPRGPW